MQSEHVFQQHVLTGLIIIRKLDSNTDNTWSVLRKDCCSTVVSRCIKYFFFLAGSFLCHWTFYWGAITFLTLSMLFKLGQPFLWPEDESIRYRSLKNKTCYNFFLIIEYFFMTVKNGVRMANQRGEPKKVWLQKQPQLSQLSLAK